MEMLSFIRSRRSTRVFLRKPVEREKLEAILEAGRYAPSGGNNQSTHFLVITNPEVLARLASLAQQLFSEMTASAVTYPSLAGAIRNSKKGGYVFHYNAPVLILAANRIDYSNNMADCACALENMMLMANALDLGSCWINQLKWLNRCPEMTQTLREIGLCENEIVLGGAVFGYPKTETGLPNREPLPRKGNPVTWVE